MKEIVIDEKTKYCIKLSVEDTGAGLACILTGGERPHVGAVALIDGADGFDASHEVGNCGENRDMGRLVGVQELHCNGHKDHIAALEVARIINKHYGQAVSVAAGIHIDDASADDIERLRRNWIAAAEQYCRDNL